MALIRLTLKSTDTVINKVCNFNNNIRTVQSESSKFALLLFDQIPNRRVVGTDWNLEFLTGGVELLWDKCTVFPVPVQGILTGGT